MPVLLRPNYNVPHRHCMTAVACVVLYHQEFRWVSVVLNPPKLLLCLVKLFSQVLHIIRYARPISANSSTRSKEDWDIMWCDILNESVVVYPRLVPIKPACIKSRHTTSLTSQASSTHYLYAVPL